MAERQRRTGSEGTGHPLGLLIERRSRHHTGHQSPFVGLLRVEAPVEQH
jgi:hypothetical protein